MLVFPDPSVSTEYTDPNGSVWEFNGTGWVRQPESSGGGGGDFTLSAQADGDISSGASVVLNSDGSVSEIRMVTMPPSFLGESEVPDRTGSAMSVAYEPISDKIVCVFKNKSNYPTIITADYSNGNFVWGTPRVIKSMSCIKFCKKLLVGTDGMIHGVFGVGVNNQQYFRYSIDGDTLKQEVAATYLFKGTPDFSQDAVYNKLTNTTTWIAPDTTSPLYCLVSTVFPDGTIAKESATNLSENSGKFSIGFDEGRNKYLIAGQDHMMVGTLSGNSMSFGPLISFQDYQGAGYGSFSYDSDAQVLVFSGSNANSSGSGWPEPPVAKSLWSMVCKIAPDNQSVEFLSPIVLHELYDCIPFSFYDKPSKQHVVVFYDKRSASPLNRYIALKVSGDLLEVTQGLTDLTSRYVNSVYCIQSDGIFLYTDNDGKVKINTVSINAPTADHRDFIGLSSGDFADGEVAVIDAAGAVNNKQSGLSADTPYYVKKDGDLSDVDTGVFAGTGVSDNEIQVRR